MAEVMGAEAAIVRIQFVSGTHAISTALFSALRCWAATRSRTM
jgi:cystathionine beta-lyase family protein involved in aluminum resistance